MRKLSRNVYFYEVGLSKYEQESNNTYVETNNFSEDMKNLFSGLEELDCDKQNLENSLYEKKASGTYDFVIIDKIDEHYIYGKLINSDDSGLTYFEENGVIKPLSEKLDNNISIAEISHFCINLDTKIMAFEYNAKCSHASSLSNYLYKKWKQLFRISFMNLQNKETLRRFNKIKRIAKFEFKASSKLLELNNISSSNKLFLALNATYGLSNNSSEIGQLITLKMQNQTLTKKQKKEGKTPYFDAQQLKNDISDITNLTEDTKEFKLDIVGLSELNEKIRVNYFKDLITSNISLDSDLSSEAFYKKLTECYLKTYQEYIK